VIGETVLIADDEPTVRMVVTEVLAELGYEAIEAALSHFELRSPGGNSQPGHVSNSSRHHPFSPGKPQNSWRSWSRLLS
jgi:hypothetical protein